MPFRFNPQWLQHQEEYDIISSTWTQYIGGSPTQVWESKLRVVK